MPRAEPTTPSRRRAARPSRSARPPPKLARTAASVAAAAASASSPPPLASTSASAPPPTTKTTATTTPGKTETTETTTTKSKTPKKSKPKDPAPTSTQTPTWRHPAELPYIRSPSTKRDDGGSGKWDDIAIVRFLVAKAGFWIPGRSSSSSGEGEFFDVCFPGASASSSASGVGVDGGDGAGEENGEKREERTVTLPTPYRLPLLWTAKYLWTSLHLVLTADPAIRGKEWRETRFEILHLARLIDVLLKTVNAPSKSPGKEDANTMDPAWRCPPFDRALRRFWHHWLISRDEFVRDFWREFGEEEFEDGDVLGLAWPRWVLKGHKGFLLTKAEVANGIDVQGFMKGFRIWGDEDGEGEGFGYPEEGGSKNKVVQPLESSESPRKNKGKTVADVEGGGREEDASKTNSKKIVVKNLKPTPLTQSQDNSDRPRHATRRSQPLGSSFLKEMVNRLTVDMLDDADLTRSQSSPEEEVHVPVDPSLPHATTTATTRPSTSQKMYIEVPPLASDDPRRNIGRRSISTAMGSVRLGQRTGRVVGFVGGDDGEKSDGGDENTQKGDGDVSMEAGDEEKIDGEEEQGIINGEANEDESELDLDSDLELGYPDEVEPTPFTSPPPNAEHEIESPGNEEKDDSEPPLSRSISPVLPPLSSARFPPPAPTLAVPSASTPPTQPPPRINQTPPPSHPPNPTSDAITHFLHAHHRTARPPRRGRGPTELEERVRRVEGRLAAGNWGARFSGNALGGGDGLNAGGEEGGDGQSDSAWAHPLAHLVSLPEGDDAMDVDVEDGKSKSKSVGGVSGSRGKKRNTPIPSGPAAEADSESRARKVGRR
ncbi:hypothetical protein R3P38DRAFT_3443537 [Favolaschia claudopus]|uniref:Uncharacterized protein n=1 Tax=Favolaschia claudopus TaxID=2862362 RepID=A0AAV9ZQA7_9AGAR